MTTWSDRLKPPIQVQLDGLTSAHLSITLRSFLEIVISFAGWCSSGTFHKTLFMDCVRNAYFNLRPKKTGTNHTHFRRWSWVAKPEGWMCFSLAFFHGDGLMKTWYFSSEPTTIEDIMWVIHCITLYSWQRVGFQLCLLRRKTSSLSFYISLSFGCHIFSCSMDTKKYGYLLHSSDAVVIVMCVMPNRKLGNTGAEMRSLFIRLWIDNPQEDLWRGKLPWCCDNNGGK